jgi:phosphate transport system substrate-binding protein
MKLIRHLREKNTAIVCLGSIIFHLITSSSLSSQTNIPSIKIDGSSTVYPITQKSVEKFKVSYRKPMKFDVKISGTTGGFRKFCQGQTDISDASRPIQKDEMELCLRNGISYIELPIAFDALTVVVNPQNTWIKRMTIAELQKIWEPNAQGKITRWNQIRSNFPNKPLNLFAPDVDSGTFDYFTEAIMKTAGKSRKDYVASKNDNVIVQGVSQDPNAIGYFGLSYYEAHSNKLKALAIDGGKGSVLPSRENVEKGIYQPLARPLFIYVNLQSAQKNSALKKFMDFYLKNTEEIVKSVNYIPLTQESYHINKVTFYKGEVGTVFGGKSQFYVTIPELQRKQGQIRLESN